MGSRIISAMFLTICFLALSCSKSASPDPGAGNSTYKLAYKDSILYLTSTATDYIVSPVQAAAGKYAGFPDGIELDPNTGAINVTKSETGLRYKISFIPSGKNDTISTEVVISGINFLDGFYKLTGPDSICRPLYNGRAANTLPGVNNGSVFDEGSNCNKNGCSVNVNNGQINLAETVRNKVFGNTPANNARQEFEMTYRINDNSGKAVNKIKVKLYYFDTMADVTPEVYAIIASRQGTIFGLRLYDGAVNTTTQRIASVENAPSPRPPCVFIIAH